MSNPGVWTSPRWPTIAAVIPVYNRPALIARAIESALAQERPPDEIIVVDDGSTDDTAVVAAAYGDPVRVIRQPNSGVSVARNAGVSNSQCEFIAFLDSDDLWDPSHLRRMECAIVATQGRAVLYFSDVLVESHYPGDTFWSVCDFQIEGAHELRADSCEWLFRARQPMLIPASTMRRDAYLAVGGSEPRLVRRGDTHLFFKIGMAGPCCAVAGYAGSLTRDDLTSVSTVFPAGDATYLECSIWLYHDLLDRPRFSSRQRRILGRRLAAGYWDVAKQKGLTAPFGAVVNAGRATRHDPAILLKRSRNRIRHFDLGITRHLADGSPE